MYVDYVFASFITKSCTLLLIKLNSPFPFIKFTVELETDRQLPFLDKIKLKNSVSKSTTFKSDTPKKKFVILPFESHKGLKVFMENLKIAFSCIVVIIFKQSLGNPKDEIFVFCIAIIVNKKYLGKIIHVP